MCGICGFTGQHEEAFAHKVLSDMMRTMVHRGPDGEGAYFGEEITLGFRRLSIIDLAEGGQPFYNETKEIASICNGEIYNYVEIREELLGKGHTFCSHCDAEVLVHAYEEWGEKLTEHLRGMYAFALWDGIHKKLIAVRDPFGIKPFYYAEIDGNLVFASEIKTILAYPGYKRALNTDALPLYLQFQYSVLPETFFKGIFRLMPGCMLIRENGKTRIERYFRAELPEKHSKEKCTDLEAKTMKRLEDAIANSVSYHLRSDTEVGILLSGGVDSIYLASAAGVKKAFSVGFAEEGYSEIAKAARVAEKFNMKHQTYLISAEEYWKTFPQIQYMMDEPLADASAAALYFLDRLAAKDVKVVLSGEGADELFGGYPIYHEPVSLNGYQRLPRGLRKTLAKIVSILPQGIKGKSFLTRGSMSLEERFIGNANNFTPAEVRTVLIDGKNSILPQELLAEDYKRSKGKNDITRMQEIDLNYWLWGDILLKSDKMSMAHSLECRVPYLDRRVYKAACTLTPEQKIHNGQTKYIFRKMASDHIPMDDAGRKKLGFPVPIRVWLKQDHWHRQVEEAFCSETAHKYFNTSELVKMLDEHVRGRMDNSRKIWTIYSFLEWYKMYFEERKMHRNEHI